MPEKYYEVAVGSPSRRGAIYSYEDYIDILYNKGGENPVYRSVYCYPEEAVKFIASNKSIKNYVGERSINIIPIDIDKGDNSDEHTLQRAQWILHELSDLGLNDENYKVFYSGTGYHITIGNESFGFEASPDLPYIVKETMRNLFDSEIDLSVYSKSALIRSSSSLNAKSGLYKVPIYKNLNSLSVEEIIELASKRTILPSEAVYQGDESLNKYIKKEVPKVRVLDKTNEPKNVVPCVQTMYNQGPISGSRNNTLLRMASHFRRNGIPSEATKASLLHWNNNTLDPRIVLEKVESVYNTGYRYSCKDVLMHKYCDPKCIHYKHKDYNVDVYSADELQNMLEERLSTDFSGRTIDLSKMFGLKDKDCTIYPGELVTIFGPTGSNKTTLAHNIILGYDFDNDEIVKEWQLPTLFLSLELSASYMHRRTLQIVSDSSKEYVSNKAKEVWDMYKDYCSHVVIQTVSATPEAIQKKISEIQPMVVVIDYIDLVETPGHLRTEYDQLRYISHFLSNLAVNSDIIIIQVSQVSREYSRNEVLDIYAGKGSGAIENASRKVIGINGKQDTATKKISLFKNSDGDLFDVDVNWKPSFRLCKTI